MNWKDRFNRKYLQISLYVIMTCIIIYILSLIAKNAPFIWHGLLVRIKWLFRVTKPIIIGFAFAYLMDPVVNFFERKFSKIKFFKKRRTPRALAVFISLFILFVAFSALISLLVFSVTDQIRLANFDDIIKLGQEYMKNLDSFYNSIKAKLNDLDIQSSEIDKYVNQASTYLLDVIRGLAESTIDSISNFSGYITTIIFSLIIGTYLMIDGRMFMAYIRKVFTALFSVKANERARRYVNDLDRVFSGYIRGQLTDAFVMMILISLVLSITGVKFAIVIGILAGIGNLIPYFGPIVAYIGTIIVCFINGEFQTMIVSIIALAVIQSIDGNFIGPKLLSRSIQIHPLIIIVSLIFGSAVGGFLGMLLAVPVGAYLKLIFVRFIDHRIEKKKELNHLDINK